MTQHLVRYVIITIVIFFSWYSCALSAPLSMQQDEWTWLYKKNFDTNEQIQNGDKKEIILSRLDVPLFTQLLFSFNAFRPRIGHFSFSVQSRDATTKQWGQWHLMIDWGTGIQRSYSSGIPGKQQYLFVRLEQGKRLADAFRVKMISYHEADLALIKGFSVTTSNLTKFKDEGIPSYCTSLTSVYIPGVPKLSQFLVEHPRNEVLCSPTSCSMLAHYLCNAPIDVALFAHNSFDHGLQQYGSWPFNMAHAFEHCTGSCYFINTRLHSFRELHAQLCRGIPVVVSVRGKVRGAPQRYDNGHLLVVIGFDHKSKEIIVHDPAAKELEQVLRKYPLKSFLAAWERSRRLAYVAEPAER